MVTLFEENEKKFDNLGLGVLSDAKSCKVKEGFNNDFILTMEYPIIGKLYKEIRLNRIVFSKATPYSNGQAFRINNITKPIKGIVTVSAVHLSYDLNYFPAMGIDAININDALDQMKTKSIIKNDFIFETDITSAKTFKTTAPYNLRAILMGGEEGLASVYKAELFFDNFKIKMMSHRGKDRNAEVRYGKNMIDLKHTSSSETLFKGVFPFYHTERSSNETQIQEGFKQVYIVDPSIPFLDGWLSYTEGGSPYHPIDESPVQIATEGDYFEKVYTWNPRYENYVEKIYNQQVTLIQGAIEPTWISIDWSQLLTTGKVICKAAKKGYFKSATDTDWGELRGVGDIIFEDFVLSSGIMSNIIIYFSEVIPNANDNKNKEVTEIVDINIADYDKEKNTWNGDPIIWLDSPDARSVLWDSILMLDLTQEFKDNNNEEPTKEQLKSKALEYISENKIGQIKHSTTVSFVDLNSTVEGVLYNNFDIIELGDNVHVVYEDLNVDVNLRVITTTYDAILDRYETIELGEVEDKISSNSVQKGDKVSSLSNDADYSTVSNVNKLIANTITAEFLEAVNAKLTNAQIKQLSVERINATGIIEASQFTIDNLVAKLLTADNAVIKNTLEAGTIKVKGDVSITSGEISISNGNDKSFRVDREGNVTANSVNITGGEITMNNGSFRVTNDGVIYAKNGIIGGFNIYDTLAKSELSFGDIGTEESVVMSKGTSGVLFSDSDVASNDLDSNTNGIYKDNWSFTAGNTFGVTNTGELYCAQGQIGLLTLDRDGKLYYGEVDIDPSHKGAIINVPEGIGEFSKISYIHTDFKYRDEYYYGGSYDHNQKYCKLEDFNYAGFKILETQYYEDDYSQYIEQYESTIRPHEIIGLSGISIDTNHKGTAFGARTKMFLFESVYDLQQDVPYAIRKVIHKFDHIIAAFVSQRNIGNLSGTSHMNNLSIRIDGSTVYVVSDSGTAKDGFFCLIFGVTDYPVNE